MPAKLRRSLFIGLGGTGAIAILHTKKRFIDTYGQVPPMIGFLCIDTDEATINKHMISNRGEKVQLEQSEFYHAKVKDAQDPYLQHRDTIFSWVPPVNVSMLKSMVFGAGQIRSNGRFALFFHIKQIMDCISGKLNSITNPMAVDSAKFAVDGSDIEINHVFSVGGGTGSGIFIDVACITKSMIDKFPGTSIKNNAYIVMPDVFNVMNTGIAMSNVKPNGYGALMDLDFLMHLDYNSDPLTIDYGNNIKIKVRTAPYDVVMVVNNKNSNGDTYEKVDGLTELIGLAMFTGASELSGGLKSPFDNLLPIIAAGTLNVINKQAWACGAGLCELFYDGNKMSNIYANKAIEYLISRMVSVCDQNSAKADLIIDKLQTRENNGHDQLIDSLLAKNPKFPLSDIQDVDNAKNEVAGYLSSEIVMPKSGELEATYNSKLCEVQGGIYNFIVDQINDECGVGNVIEILENINKQYLLFRGEMEEERGIHKSKAEILDHQRENALNDLREGSKKIIGRRGAVQNAKDDILEAVNNLALARREIIRREQAIRFYNEIMLYVTDLLDKMKRIKANLGLVAEDVNSRALKIQNKDESKTFVIDLHRDEINNVIINKEEVNVADFIRTLHIKDSLMSFAGLDAKNMQDYLWEYARNLPSALALRNKNIEEVLQGMSDEQFDKVVGDMLDKSNPLFVYNYEGIVLNPHLHTVFLIGVPDAANSRLKKSGVLKSKITGSNNVDFASTRVNDRVVVYRQIAATPIYAVSDVKGYKELYDGSRVCHHIDKFWKERMDDEFLSLRPEAEDSSAMESWVAGLLCGYIKNEGGMYKVKSRRKGKAIFDYWFDLADTRLKAFQTFKKLGLGEELEKEVNEFIEKNYDSYKQTHKDACKNYFEKYSQTNMTLDEVKRNVTLLAQINKEIETIQKQMI